MDGPKRNRATRACVNVARSSASIRKPMHKDNQAYLRHPNLLGDRIVFVTDDDIWQVSASGGIARRLTAGLSEPSTPCLSPDGRWIAFVSRDEQHPEVYLMASDGGLARRMTWLGPDTMVRGWTPEGPSCSSRPTASRSSATIARTRWIPNGGCAAAAAARTGQSSGVRSERVEDHRSQHRGPCALEALPGRHGRPSVDRRQGQRRVPAA